ncbi:hypothetical protein CFN78_18365 [Amycolatopsis antarctica]|uniref:Uncharacterized protein n=1 Tax=Amycolatopsis antarctica TaxID=1854586 RepID=A0A263D032_9PSEU|nr:hypothetical protein [Amycolatopsis antarctica]OZM71793.1 hypothetical protein CFN78_18365 [Amycolatopsis antarctica]
MTTDPYRGAPYGRTPSSADPYAAAPYSSGPPGQAHGERTGARVLAALGGVVLTPVALALMMYGAHVNQRDYVRAIDQVEPAGALFLLLGAILLAGIASLGLVSGLGPVASCGAWPPGSSARCRRRRAPG